MLLETGFICDVVEGDVGDIWHCAYTWVGRINL